MSAPVPDSAPDSAPDNAPGLRVNGAARPLGDGTLTGVLEAAAVDIQARGLAVAVSMAKALGIKMVATPTAGNAGAAAAAYTARAGIDGKWRGLFFTSWNLSWMTLAGGR